MENDEQKQAIMELSLRERTVAVALKRIYDQVKVLKQQSNEEMQGVKQKYYPRFKQIQEETNKIIKGKSITKRQINRCLQSFENEEPSRIYQIAEANKKIDRYWLKALISFYGEQMTQADRQIAKSITAISLNYFKDALEISFEIGINSYVRSEIFIKRCTIEEGCLAKVAGEARWLKPRPDGIFGLLFCENAALNLIQTTLVIAQQFIVQIIPYSFQYYMDYLGANHQNENQEAMVQNFNGLSVGTSKKRKE